MGRRRMSLERSDSLKRAIWPLGLDHPLIAVAERNVEESTRHRVGHFGSLVQSHLAFCKARAKREGDLRRGSYHTTPCLVYVTNNKHWSPVAGQARPSLTHSYMGHHDQVDQKERASFAASNIPTPISTMLNGS
jgi:hypothetical protein